MSFMSPVLQADSLLLSHWGRSQRTARRDKKAFLSEQCKEIEENNRIGKTRGLFNKIEATKGTFHSKDRHNKGKKHQGSGEIKKR